MTKIGRCHRCHRHRFCLFYFCVVPAYSYLCTMNSKLLKLDAPYDVIYAGGIVGRHIATLMVWNDDEEAAGGIMDSASYPVIDEGEEFPAGTLVDYAELHDCRVICSYSERMKCNATNIYWIAKMIEYDSQQLEPAGAEYILERMKLLGCKIVMPTKKVETKDEKDEKKEEEMPIYDFEATLDVWCMQGFGEPDSVYRVRSNRYQGFYFYSEGTRKEIYHDLSYQMSVYRTYCSDLITVHFHSDDLEFLKVTNRLNADQHIEGFKHEDDADWN